MTVTILPDHLSDGLKAVFVGTSVAKASHSARHYYSGPGNKFWELLWDAGLTGDRILSPSQDSRMLSFGLGLTDLVKHKAASSDSNLRSRDFDIEGFVAKVKEFQPGVVAFNGKTAAAKVLRSLGERDTSLGWSASQIGESRVFILPSSSGANADRRNFAPKATKAEWWQELGRAL